MLSIASRRCGFRSKQLRTGGNVQKSAEPSWPYAIQQRSQSADRYSTDRVLRIWPMCKLYVDVYLLHVALSAGSIISGKFPHHANTI